MLDILAVPQSSVCSQHWWVRRGQGCCKKTTRKNHAGFLKKPTQKKTIKTTKKTTLYFCFEKSTKAGFTQNPATAYEPVYGQRQSSHMQQEHHHRQPRQSGLLKTILSKPEAGQNRENSPGYGQRSLCEDCR